MKALPMVGGVLVWCLCLPPAAAAAPKQPPMNDFNFAFYTCDGAAFQVAYDSNTPTTATLTTSRDNQRYVLTRTSSGELQFAKAGVKFQPSGRSAVVQGTKGPLKDCKLKSD
jgi:hypothetical protein